MRRRPGHPGPRTRRTWDTRGSKRPHPRSIPKLGEPRTRSAPTEEKPDSKNPDRSKPGRGASQTQDTSPGRGTGAASTPLAAEFCQTLSVFILSVPFLSFLFQPFLFNCTCGAFLFTVGERQQVFSRLPPPSERCGGSPRPSLGTPSDEKPFEAES